MIDIIKSVVFFIINGFRRIIYSLFLLCDIQENSIYVNCFDGRGFGDNPKYIINELKKINSNIKVYWIHNGNSKIENVTYIKPISIKSMYYQAVSKIWISTVRMPYYSFKRKEQIYIFTWHAGLAFKKVENECPDALSSRYLRMARHDSKMIDYYVSANADNTNLFLNYFYYHGGKVLEIGAPRNDIFFGENKRFAQQFKKKLDLSNCKVALYAPTFRKSGSFDNYNIDYNHLLISLNKRWKGNWKVIVRLHPRLAAYSDRLVQYNNIIIDGSAIDDVQELLLITDVLITDYSSIAFDYINTYRPVFIFATDINEYKKDRDFHLKLEDTPFPISQNNNELINNIENFNDNNYMKKVKKFQNKYGYYENGKASVYLANMINNLL